MSHIESNLLTAFPPIASKDACILVLGSMPGRRSLVDQEYYAHPGNAFWKIICDTTGCGSSGCNSKGSAADDYETRKAILLQNKIAVWDVLLHCERPGSLDSKIKPASMVCNDFHAFFQIHRKISKILFNGKTAENVYRRHVEQSHPDLYAPLLQKPTLYSLPSTSPAMASLSYPRKLDIWSQALL